MRKDLPSGPHVSTINDGRAQADEDLEERMPIDWKVEVAELRRGRPRFSDSGDVEARRQAHLPDAGLTTDSLEGDWRAVPAEAWSVIYDRFGPTSRVGCSTCMNWLKDIGKRVSICCGLPNIGGLMVPVRLYHVPRTMALNMKACLAT